MIAPLRLLSNFYRKKKYLKFCPEDQRQDDIYLVSFPRSGNTWISFLLANVVSEYLSLNKEINFFNIRDFVPDIHVSRNIHEPSKYYPFSRIIKSHSIYNPYYKKVFLLIRDPRDVMISYYKYLYGLGNFKGSITDLINNSKRGIKYWNFHTKSWLEESKHYQRIHLFKYEDFKKSPNNQLNKMFDIMGYTICDDIIDRAINKSKFDKMRKLEKGTAGFSFTQSENFKFVRKGKMKEWKQGLVENDVKVINNVSGELIKKLGYKI